MLKSRSPKRIKSRIMVDINRVEETKNTDATYLYFYKGDDGTINDTINGTLRGNCSEIPNSWNLHN